MCEGLGEAVTDSTFVKNRQFLMFDDIEEVEEVRRKVYFHLEHPVRYFSPILGEFLRNSGKLISLESSIHLMMTRSKIGMRDSLRSMPLSSVNIVMTVMTHYLVEPLPENIHVQSLRIRDMSSDDVAVKFMNFWEAKGDDSVTTRSGVVQLDKLFSVFDSQRTRFVSITLNRGFYFFFNPTHWLGYDELQRVEYPASGKQLAK